MQQSLVANRDREKKTTVLKNDVRYVVFWAISERNSAASTQMLSGQAAGLCRER